MENPVIVWAYDPDWPGRFQSLRERIADALGDMAAAIEHVGSTAVPGLAAKPIIDIGAKNCGSACNARASRLK